MSAAPTLRRTPLYEAHLAAGAKLVDFAGWEMPVQYEGVRPEHMAVRQSAGIFDVSHMGEIETSGPQALELLQRLLSNDVASIGVGGSQYSVLCREDGGILDDLFTYRLGSERFLTVTNASNHESDLAWFTEHAAAFPGAEVTDRIEDWAMLAVQGPLAREMVQAGAESPLPARMTVGTRRIGGAEMLVCGTGYTGEDGVELLCRPSRPSICGSSSFAVVHGPRVSVPATRCAWRSASTSTATTSASSAARSRAGWAGAARRTRASSAPRPSGPCARPARPRSSSPSSSTGPVSRARATR